MATAVRNSPRPVTPPPATYTLTLSEHEANVLADLLGGHVIGPYDGPRGVTSGIYVVLRAAGVRYWPHSYFEDGNVKGKRA